MSRGLIAVVFGAVVAIGMGCVGARDAAVVTEAPSSLSLTQAVPARSPGFVQLSILIENNLLVPPVRMEQILSFPISGTEVDSAFGATIPIQNVSNNTVTVSFRPAGTSIRGAVAGQPKAAANQLLLRLSLEDARPLEQLNLPVRASDLPQVSVHRVSGLWAIEEGQPTVLHRFEQLVAGVRRTWTLTVVGSWLAAESPSVRRLETFAPYAASVTAVFEQDGAEIQRAVSSGLLNGDKGPAARDFAITEIEFSHGRQMPVTTVSNSTETSSYGDATDALTVALVDNIVAVTFSRSRLDVLADARSTKQSPITNQTRLFWSAGQVPVRYAGSPWQLDRSGTRNRLTFERLEVGSPTP